MAVTVVVLCKILVLKKCWTQRQHSDHLFNIMQSSKGIYVEEEKRYRNQYFVVWYLGIWIHNSVLTLCGGWRINCFHENYIIHFRLWLVSMSDQYVWTEYKLILDLYLPELSMTDHFRPRVTFLLRYNQSHETIYTFFLSTMTSIFFQNVIFEKLITRLYT